jgi:hypothetical protein
MTEEEQRIKSEILQSRSEKDSLFQVADWSPILENERSDFNGLNYFPVDLHWRFEGPIVTYDSLIKDTIAGTKGDLRPAMRYGYFEFTVHKKPARLEIYKIIRSDTAYQDYLFLGFTDRTTGKSTYGTGRYIDLSIRRDNHYIIDFNKAYNPYCAYNPRYTCAIPPDENALPFAVEAGEKIYKDH